MGGLRYLLDTNILSALIRQPQGPVAAMLARRGYGTVCTSIVAAELRFGARKLGSSALSRKVDDLLASLPVLPLEAGVDQPYAECHFQLDQAGTSIGPNELPIAAQALDLGFTVVTDNADQFVRISGLRAENWLVTPASAPE